MNDLNVLEVPMCKVGFLDPKPNVLLLSSMNPYQNPDEQNINLNDPIIETDIYDTTLGAFSSHSQFNDFIKVQDPYKTESDINSDSGNLNSDANLSSPSTSKNSNDMPNEHERVQLNLTPNLDQKSNETSDKKPIFDPIEDEKKSIDSESSYLASYAYSYYYTLSSECEVVDESSNDKKNIISRSPDRLSRSCDIKKISNNNSNISDDEIQKFRKSNVLSISHDIKKMDTNNYNDDKEHVSWTFPQQYHSRDPNGEATPQTRTADIYKVELNEDDEAALKCNQNDNANAPQASPMKLSFSPYFLVDASIKMVEESDNEYYEYEEEQETKIQTAPESEIQGTPEPKSTFESPSPAPSSSTIVNSELKSNSPPIVNEPNVETKSRSPRNKNTVRFENVTNQTPGKLEEIGMFSESACILSESERDCYKIDEI